VATGQVARSSSPANHPKPRGSVPCSSQFHRDERALGYDVAGRGWSYTGWSQAVSESGSSPFHHLQLLSSASFARPARRQGNRRGRAGTDSGAARARVYAYFLMPEHVHLLMNEPPSILVAQFLKAVKQITSRTLRGAREKFWRSDPLYSSQSGRAWSGREAGAMALVQLPAIRYRG